MNQSLHALPHPPPLEERKKEEEGKRQQRCRASLGAAARRPVSDSGEGEERGSFMGTTGSLRKSWRVSVEEPPYSVEETPYWDLRCAAVSRGPKGPEGASSTDNCSHGQPVLPVLRAQCRATSRHTLLGCPGSLGPDLRCSVCGVCVGVCGVARVVSPVSFVGFSVCLVGVSFLFVLRLSPVVGRLVWWVWVLLL